MHVLMPAGKQRTLGPATLEPVDQLEPDRRPV